MRTEFVSVKPVIISDAPDAHQVWLDIGIQHFTIGEYCETKDDAEWLAAQLRIALTALQAGAGDGELPAIGSVADRLVYYADRIVIAEPHLHKGAKFTKWAYGIAEDMRKDAVLLSTESK